jgi:polyisoprenoid-binding protein YceI
MLGACVLICAAASPGAAQEWRVNQAESRVSLRLSLDGQAVEGLFGGYKVTIRFDPEEAADGEITALIDAASLVTGDPARDALLYSPDWLNAGAYPSIRLTSVRIRETEAPNYRLDADLTLRGATRRMTAPLTIDDQGTAGKIHAEFPVSPADFGISQIGAGPMLLVIDLAATHLTN